MNQHGGRLHLMNAPRGGASVQPSGKTLNKDPTPIGLSASLKRPKPPENSLIEIMNSAMTIPSVLA
jgi:hypothetical protein